MEPSGIVRVIVYKSRRILEVWREDLLLLCVPVALGREPRGHKMCEGDGKTPEGAYHACVRNHKSKYHLSIGIDYPNRLDAERAFAEGVLNREQYDCITTALDAGARPPWGTALGGEIMIHGGGASPDWTAGCIALDNADMDKLWELVPIGTEITILQ